MITSCGGNDQPAYAPKTSEAPGLSQSEVTDVATEAYTYAYPLVTMEYTRRSVTNVPVPRTPTRRWVSSPACTFSQRREPQRDAPNVDTPNSQAWFDVSKEP